MCRKTVVHGGGGVGIVPNVRHTFDKERGWVNVRCYGSPSVHLTSSSGPGLQGSSYNAEQVFLTMIRLTG